MKILFTGGGTAGHITPIIAITREIRRIQENVQLFYMGPRDSFGDMLLSQENIVIQHVFAGKLRRYGGPKNILQNIVDILFKIPVGVVQAFFKLFFLAPDLVFCKGGYGALPVVIAAWVLRTPIVLHESDIVPGLSNRIAGFFASQIFVSFPSTQYFSKNKMTQTGNPIRREMLSGSKEEAKRLFHLQGDRPLLLILGGSQGSTRINDMFLAILNPMLDEFEILHQTGEKNFSQVTAEAKVAMGPEDTLYYHAVPFFKETELRHAYATANVILSRAGSGSIFEIAALGKPAVLVPFPEAAQNHQVQNAYAYAATGAAIVLEQANLTPNFFFEKLRYLFTHAQEKEKMATAAHAFSKPEAASNIAQYLLAYLKR
jgi:UDP-N-acetylglucosamine--N-acetylmuramyl-(pentapeptide) pyrophosphoryl-undecaprenol N-acetylglucosamine transferase